MTVIIGVDPGLSGAIALLGLDGQLHHVADMPTADGRVTPGALAWWLGHDDAVVGIELVHSMPGQGVSSTFKFGASWGVVHGAFGAVGCRVVDVRPQDWKRTFKLGKDKDKARRLAAERWPGSAMEFARKKDAGRAEAALIAEYTRQALAIENGSWAAHQLTTPPDTDDD